jgi:uncharacterized protein YacL
LFIAVRLVFVIVAIIIGFGIGGPPGAAVGLAAGAAVFALELGLGRTSGRAVLAGTLGLILGWVVATAVGHLLSLSGSLAPFRFAVFGCAYLVFGYLGMVIALRKRDEILPAARGGRAAGIPGGASVKLLDTSAIIDGRVADVAETKFLEGRVVIPRFVLRELQVIADSQDPLRRARGRRGLEILRRLQDGEDVDVEIEDVDVEEARDVDAKLVLLAKKRGARVVTTDFNLNRVAQLEGVSVLNLNDLANALKPVVLPGEGLTVRIMKKGKELEQGVGYLDDGTMVVVEGAAGLIGQDLRVVTTSVLQTTAGRMIFAERKE